MYTNLKAKFIVVDDDYINNELCRINIEEVFPEANIETFTVPEAALLYIKSTVVDVNVLISILFFDINMPTLSGWEFLESYELFDELIKNKIRIYMLSSSVDHRDKKRATDNKNVLGYFEKPLTTENIKEVIKKLLDK